VGEKVYSVRQSMRKIVCKAVYEKNREFREKPGQVLVESEKRFFLKR